LGNTGDPAAIELLLARREKEAGIRTLRAIDDNLDKLRRQQAELEKVRRELETLRTDNRQLKQRLEKLEAAATNE